MANKLKDHCFVNHRLHILKEIEESGFVYVPLRLEIIDYSASKLINDESTMKIILIFSVSTFYSNFCRCLLIIN